MSITAASPCPDSIARCSGVLPTLSPVFKRGFGLPSGGFSKSAIKAVDPVVAARCLLVHQYGGSWAKLRVHLTVAAGLRGLER